MNFTVFRHFIGVIDIKRVYNINKLVEYLEKNKLLYFIEYKIIKYHQPAFDFEVFTYDGETFLLIQHMPYGTYASIINYNQETYDIYLKFLKENYEHFSLSITLSSTTENNNALKVENNVIYKTFIGEKKGIRSDSIRRATNLDQKLIEAFKQENDKHIITLKDAFTEYVINSESKGEIFLCVLNDLVIGYLICAEEFENIWDVVYIYVKPEYRNKGYGKMLASEYNFNKKSQNQIPLYTGVTNIASEKVALNSGFKLCSSIVYYNY